MRNAQVSLEYLLLLAAFFSALLLFLPLLSKVYSLGIFGMDVARAKAFSQNLQQEIHGLEIFADGSKKTLVAEPLCEWQLSQRQGKFFLVVRSRELEREKTIEIPLDREISFRELSISSRAVFLLKKENGEISLEPQ